MYVHSVQPSISGGPSAAASTAAVDVVPLHGRRWHHRGRAAALFGLVVTGAQGKHMWKVVTWSPTTESGTIAGPHLGPLPFDGRTTSVRDFVVGEEVAVKLEGAGATLRVRALSPLRARQPPGTQHAAFDALHALAGC